MSVSLHSSSDDEQPSDLFQEPSDYYAPEKPATFTKYQSENGLEITLRMVGHSPLWGHLLWNAGQVIAQYLEDHPKIVENKSILELGAGVGLPSLVAATLGAKKVVVTDYPEDELIDNLSYNIEHCTALKSKQNIIAKPFLWGSSLTSLLSCLDDNDCGTFDVLILADILFNHSEHNKLITTVQQALKKNSDAQALVFFTPYRPWLLEKDMNFFDLAKDAGFEVSKLFEHTMDSLMFDNDPGDETLRRTVFAYKLGWPSRMNEMQR